MVPEEAGTTQARRRQGTDGGEAGDRVTVVRCVVGDGSEVFGEGLKTVLESTGEVVVLARVADPLDLLPAVDELMPDVVVASYEPPSQAVTAARSVSAVPVVVLTWSKRQEDLLDAMRGGARGYLHKDVSLDELVATLRDVARGRSSFPRGAERMLVDLLDGRVVLGQRRADTFALTRREQEIVQLVVDGYSNKAVAGALGIAHQTAKNHVRHVMAKLNVSSRTQLCTWAIEHGYAPTHTSVS